MAYKKIEKTLRQKIICERRASRQSRGQSVGPFHLVHFGFATVSFRKMAEASRRGKQKRKQVLKVTYCYVFLIVKCVLLIVLEGAV